MDKDFKRKILIILAVVIILLIILIGYIIYKFNKNLANNDKGISSYSGNNTNNNKENVDKITENEKDDIEKTAIQRAGTNNLPQLVNVDYSALARYQFSRPTETDTYIKVYFNNLNEPIEIKLFDKLAPNTTKQFLEGIKKNMHLNKHATMSTFRDLIFNFGVDNTNQPIFTQVDRNDINYALVPYKGALMKNGKLSLKSNGDQLFNIILQDEKKVNEKIIENKAISQSLVNELSNRKGRLESEYLNNIIFGQVTNGIEKLEEMANDYKKNIKDIYNKTYSYPYITKIEVNDPYKKTKITY